MRVLKNFEEIIDNIIRLLFKIRFIIYNFFIKLNNSLNASGHCVRPDLNKNFFEQWLTICAYNEYNVIIKKCP